jgi:hypothetical protein
MLVFLAAFLFLPVEKSQAAPPATVLAEIRKAYSPISSAEVRDAGLSTVGCILQDVTLHGRDPVDGSAGLVHARVYNPAYQPANRSARTILLLPPMGGENSVDRGYANRLCLSDFRVVIARDWSHNDDHDLDLGVYDRDALRAITALHRLVDYIHPDHPGQLGLMGTSVGAIEGAMELGLEPRIQTAVLIVGGAGMPEILGSSDLDSLSSLRAQRAEAFGFRSREEYINALREHVHFDPKDFAGFSGPKKVLAFLATEDTTVPTPNQWILVNALGAMVETIGAGHIGAIVGVFDSKQGKIEDFFEKNLR